MGIGGAAAKPVGNMVVMNYDQQLNRCPKFKKYEMEVRDE